LITVVALLFFAYILFGYLTGPGPSYDITVDVVFNGKVQNSLTATTNSEDFKNFFMQNISTIVTENGVDKPIDLWSWGHNETIVHIGTWVSTPINSISEERLEKIGQNITATVAKQWYAETVDVGMICGDNFSHSVIIVIIISIIEAIFLAFVWSRKSSTEENSIKNTLSKLRQSRMTGKEKEIRRLNNKINYKNSG
jgi:hypothetical protein